MADYLLWFAALLVVIVVTFLQLRRRFARDRAVEGQDEQAADADKESQRWELIGALVVGGGYAAWVLVKWWQTGEFPSRSEMF